MIARRLLLACAACLIMTSAGADHGVHVVEELTFQVASKDAEEFLKHDAAIWTAVLGEQPGFLAKETWLGRRDEIKLIIRWHTKNDWDALPKPLLQATDKRFHAAMGSTGWAMTSSRGYGVVLPGNQSNYINIDALLTADRLRLATLIEIPKDPVYFQAKRYLAVPLKDTIAALAKQEEADEIVFECVDDYASRMLLDDFFAGDPWLAFRDADAREGEAWVQQSKGPSPEKMGKAYVIWRDAEKPGELTWPYAVERIRVVKRDE